MTKFLFLLLWLSTGFAARAQQLLCEREQRVPYPAVIAPISLLRLQPDSLRVVGTYSPNITGPPTLRARIQRVVTARCDTLATGPSFSPVNHTDRYATWACTNRRGQVLLSQMTVRPRPTGGSYDSTLIQLQFFNRDGTSRWQRILAPRATLEEARGILEAPENGFFLFGGEAYPIPSNVPATYNTVIRIDSTGRELWRRRYRHTANYTPTAPVYTRTGTTIIVTDSFVVAPTLQVQEYNQRGDRVSNKLLVIEPQQQTMLVPYASLNALQPLRDGSFALVGWVDSLSTGYFRPFLARFDAQGNLLWRYIYRPQATLNWRFAQPRELADGTLLVVASSLPGGGNTPFCFLRFTATGQLLARYRFTSQVLVPTPFGEGYLSRVMGLEALSDSTLVMLAERNNPVGFSSTYLAHLRIPGLPRLLDNHVVPAADPLATRPPLPAPAWPGRPAYPNPAATTLTVPYRRPPGARALRLRVSDALGRAVLAQPLAPATEGAAELNVRAWPPGLYLLTLEADGRPLARQRVVVVR